MRGARDTLGILLIVAGILVISHGRVRLPLGRLPGDIAYRSKSFSFYLPVATSLLLSLLLTVIFYLISRFRR